MKRKGKAGGVVADLEATPTQEQWGTYEAAFDYWNKELFGGEVPPVMLNFSRHAKAQGFYSPGKWLRGSRAEVEAGIPPGLQAGEITINPDVILEQTPINVQSTLVHEMVHHWQQYFGVVSRGGYHNREWANKMKEIGLYPSSTEAPGGKEVGQKVSHYIVAGGAFENCFHRMPKRLLLPWLATPPGEGKKAKRKTTYRCPRCGYTAWGKPRLPLGCLACGSALVESAAGNDENDENQPEEA